MLDLAAELETLALLPEGIESDSLVPYWDRILDSWDAAPGPIELYAECLCELANRQWHTYEKANPEVQRRVAVWVSRAWHDAAGECRDACVTIIGTLGLDPCVDLIRAAVRNPETPPAVAEDLGRELKAWGDAPLDPWRSLRKFRS